jgi:hypothetical protein
MKWISIFIFICHLTYGQNRIEYTLNTDMASGGFYQIAYENDYIFEKSSNYDTTKVKFSLKRNCSRLIVLKLDSVINDTCYISEISKFTGSVTSSSCECTVSANIISESIFNTIMINGLRIQEIDNDTFFKYSYDQIIIERFDNGYVRRILYGDEFGELQVEMIYDKFGVCILEKRY